MFDPGNNYALARRYMAVRVEFAEHPYQGLLSLPYNDRIEHGYRSQKHRSLLSVHVRATKGDV